MLGVPLSCMHKLPGDCDEEGCPRHGWDLRCPLPHSSENAVFLFSSIFFQSLYCCFKTRTQVVTLLNVYGQIAHILILCWLWNYNQYHFFFFEKGFHVTHVAQAGFELLSYLRMTWTPSFSPPSTAWVFGIAGTHLHASFTQCWGSHPGPCLCSISALPAETHLSLSCRLLESNILLLLFYWKLWLRTNLENFIAYGINEWSFPMTPPMWTKHFTWVSY